MDTSKKVSLPRVYELTYLVPGSVAEKDNAQIKTEVESLLTQRYKGAIIKSEDWGKKQMAYTMTHEGQKQTDAFYTHIMFTMERDQVQAFEHDIFLNTKIMRHLLVIADDQSAVEAA